MTDRFEDAIGRVAMIIAFVVLAVAQIYSVVAVANARTTTALWLLVFISRAIGLAFLLLVVFFTLRRLPPKQSARGFGPRITAVAGTFITLFLVVLPSSEVPPGFQIFATVLIATGTALSAFCIIWLGRSFSIMASSRLLVVKGPYRFVRHPLYTAESLTLAGIFIANWSIWAAFLGVFWAALQYQRALNEEGVLRASFPEYDDYAKTVPKFVPNLLSAFNPRLGHSA